jgi:hypothetical protein
VSSIPKPIFEIDFHAELSHTFPCRETFVDAEVVHESGKRYIIPAFWRGGSRWSVRFYAPWAGRYSGRTRCTSHPHDKGLHDVVFEFKIEKKAYEHPLYRHGIIRTRNNAFVFEDGTPFRWLGDTWWMGLSRFSRKDFHDLLRKRRAQGFTLVQLVAGLYPDMAPFDPRGTSETGFAWEKNFERINPAFFDMADTKIEAAVDAGIVPFIFGMWGYYALFMGEEKVRSHWRYLIARWSAYPVLWSLAGETSMPWYLSKNKKEEHTKLKRLWSDTAHYIRSIEPYGRLVSAHPVHMAHRELDVPDVLDFEMLQTGHGEKESLRSAVATLRAAYEETPHKPIVMNEINYEGILGKNHADIQRSGFWISLLCGASGFTYGANGIWQVNEESRPFGPSPGGNDWGKTPWNLAANLEGGEQISAASRRLEHYVSPVVLEPMPTALSEHGSEKNIDAPFCAGIAERLRIVYCTDKHALFRWRRLRMYGLEPLASYEAIFYDPRLNEEISRHIVTADAKGVWKFPRLRFRNDWVLLLRRRSAHRSDNA